jgi:ectoine hydroxylase-related dioxygenase (phytanoyl-CoA dioxygenase family)
MVAIAERLTHVAWPRRYERLPRPDYARHPAYGQLFGRQPLSLRLQAVQKLWPSLKEQFAIVRATAPARKGRPAQAGTLHERMSRNGAVALSLNAEEMLELRHLMGPAIEQVRLRKAAIQARDRAFKDMVLRLSLKTHPEVIRSLRAALERHGVVDAASAYLGVPVVMREVVRLQITDANDQPWHAHFEDIALRDPATTYMHIDSEPRFVKGMLYLNEVTQDNGPFSYVLGTNNVRMSRFEYMVRKANDVSGLDKCDPAMRRLFSALPRALQLKSEFGNDLLDSSPQAAALLAREHPFTSSDGDLIVFDNNGVHRGKRVVSGERHAVQIQFRPLTAAAE